VRNFDLMILLSVRESNRINRNISENGHKKKNFLGAGWVGGQRKKDQKIAKKDQKIALLGLFQERGNGKKYRKIVKRPKNNTIKPLYTMYKNPGGAWLPCPPLPMPILSVVPAQCLGYTAKKRVLGSVVIQLYTDDCTPSVDRASRVEAEKISSLSPDRVT